MSALLAAGACVEGPPDCRVRLWWVGQDRRLGWVRDGEPVAVANAVPGDASILCADVVSRDPLVVCTDGSAWRCAMTSWAKPWIGERNVLGGGGVVQSKNRETKTVARETLVVAGVERREASWRLWGCTNARQIICANENLARRDIGTPVPGTAPIVAVRLAGDLAAEVLLGDGSLLNWTSGGWVKSADVLAPSGSSLMRVRATESFSLGGGKDVAVGEVFEIAPAEAKRLISAGRAAHVPLDAA